ncbi:MAG TPA: hypothetical protein VF519_14625 [Mycobacteriales bacterium]
MVTRRAAATAVAALLAAPLVACGGDAKPAPTPPPLPPEAREVRDAVARTLARCPCEVRLRVEASGATSYDASLRGTYDPKAQTADLREVTGTVPTGIVVRVVGGRTFVDPDLGQWIELSFAGLPKEPVSALVPLALADPRIAFAAAGAVTTGVREETGDAGTRYGVEVDLAATAAASGSSNDLVRRVFPGAAAYTDVWLKDGVLSQVRLGADTPGALGVLLTVLRIDLPATPVTAPDVLRTVDVATEQTTT